MKTKICCTCKEEKPIDEFHKKDKEGLRRNAKCSECMKIYLKEHYSKNKDYYLKKTADQRVYSLALLKLVKENAGGCLIPSCSEDELVCMDFHHLDPTKKNVEPAKMGHNGWSIKRILKELENCVVVCSNCHRKIHAGIIPEKDVHYAMALMDLAGLNQDIEKNLIIK